MVWIARLTLVLVCSLLAAPAWAQESRSWLGIEVRDLTRAEATRLGWDTPRGVIVLRAPERGSPAERVGLKAGEIILSIDRTEIDGAAEFNSIVGAKRAGAEVQIRVLANGRERRITAMLVERPRTTTASETSLPQIMLDTGGHMSVINGLAFSPDGKSLVSGSEDKVIRVWDWQTGRTKRFIRGQAEAGQDGKIFAIALSPDGRWLAASGLMKVPGEAGYVVRLYDFSTGALVALLKGHTSVVLGLDFAPDSKRLISGSTDSTAIIWDIESRKLIHHLEGHKRSVYAVAFTPDGTRVVSGSDDTTLKLRSVRTGEEFATLSGHQSEVRALAVSADGTVASGSVDGEIRLWDSKTGRFLRTLAKQGSYVGSLRYSPDGKRLLSTCGYSGCDYTQRVWDVATGKTSVAYTKHRNVIVAAAIGPGGLLAATGGGSNEGAHIWDLSTGETKHTLAGKGAPQWTAGFFADGQRIGWGTRTKPGWKVNDYADPAFALRLAGGSSGLGRPEPLSGDMASSFLRPQPTKGLYTLSHRKGGAHGYDAILDVAKDGKLEASIERTSSDGYDHHAYTFSPDGQIIISGGSNGFLTAYDLKGRRLGQYVGHEGDVWSAVPSPNGLLLVSGSADQTVRLWNLRTRELIVTLFHGSDGEWVMWTPQGYYTGSPGGDKIIGWQINKGQESAAEFVGADQLRRHLNRPDIVEKAILMASAEQAMRESHGTSFKLADLQSRPVPKFRIVSPETDSIQRGGRVQVKIHAESVPDTVKYIRVQVNGRQIEEISAPMDSGGLGAGERTFDVPLASGRNEIRIMLGNVVGIKAETITLQHEGDGDLDKSGTLYILAIGVDRYPGLGNTCGPNNNASCDLRFSGADARRLADSAERRLAPSHGKVVKRVLINGVSAEDAPTASNILDGIDILKQSKETDTVVLFIAGHGANDGSSYRFLATNAERSGDTYRTATVVPWHYLQDAIETIKGRRILFVDTCHSGNSYNLQLGNASYHANIIAYTATRNDQQSLEDARLGHGLFTYAVTEGLDGKGQAAGKREISTRGLADYVVKRVDQLAKAMQSEQEPQYFQARDAEDYVLARW